MMPTDGHIKHHMTRTGYAPHIWKPWNDNKRFLRVITSLPGEPVDWFICNHDETGEITAIARNKEAAHKLAALLRMTAKRLEKEASDFDGGTTE